MRRRKRITRKQSEATKPSFISHGQHSNFYEGERLVRLLKSMEREIELSKRTKGSLPDKIWIKQQYAIGVNDVTRVLERITPSTNSGSSDQQPPVNCNHGKASTVQLQAVLLACDCNHKWLTKHLPSLASSRSVPLIYVRDNKGRSIRLGALVKLKTAMAIGVKAKESGINKLIKDILKVILMQNVNCQCPESWMKTICKHSKGGQFHGHDSSNAIRQRQTASHSDLVFI